MLQLLTSRTRAKSIAKKAIVGTVHGSYLGNMAVRSEPFYWLHTEAYLFMLRLFLRLPKRPSSAPYTSARKHACTQRTFLSATYGSITFVTIWHVVTFRTESLPFKPCAAHIFKTRLWSVRQTMATSISAPALRILDLIPAPFTRLEFHSVLLGEGFSHCVNHPL